MKEKPILFSAPMVRAILEGRKTATRRALKPQPWKNEAGLWVWPPPSSKVSKRTWRGFCQADEDGLQSWFAGQHRASKALHYTPGDRLWVRETCWAEENEEGVDGVRYVADMAWLPIDNTPEASERWLDLHWYGRKCDGGGLMRQGKQVPSIHMPRWASRITLLVKEVRVERVQEISQTDAKAEGIRRFDQLTDNPLTGSWSWADDQPRYQSATTAFRRLWDSINAKRPGRSWADNPWVVIVTFERTS